MALFNDLTAIGFTEYEAKVYLAMLREHPATGYQLSKESGVPRSMVYETLRRLHGRGIALETVEGRSTLYSPLPPQILIQQHESDHRQLLGNLKLGLDELYEETPDDRVWTISGRATTLAYAVKLMQEAAEELYLVLADADLAELRDDIIVAWGRGVSVNTLLTGESSLNCGQVARHPPLESQIQGLTATMLVVADSHEALVSSASPNRQTKTTITSNTDLVLIARQFVWMELFTQRIYARLGPDLLALLDPVDREIFESLALANKPAGNS